MWYDPLNSFNPIFIDQDITLKPLEGKNGHNKQSSAGSRSRFPPDPGIPGHISKLTSRFSPIPRFFSKRRTLVQKWKTPKIGGFPSQRCRNDPDDPIGSHDGLLES